MQTNTTRYHYTPVRMAKIQSIDSTKCWQGRRSTGTLTPCWWDCKKVRRRKTSLGVPDKAECALTIESAIVLLGIYPREWETWVPTKICMLIAALFVLAKTWKQPRCPSVDDRINKLCYSQALGCYSALKRNGLSSLEQTWQDLQCLLLSEWN